MGFFDDNDAKEILKACNIGLWRVEMEEGKPTRFYADEIMCELMGVPMEVSPEDRFLIHFKNVHPDDLQMFILYSKKLHDKRTEVVYRYIHPEKGEMYVRCSGLKGEKKDGCEIIYGTHQDISETVRYEKEKTAEQRLAEAVEEKEAALEEAKRASAAKSEFLSRMSHDIRTPLNGLIGLIEINDTHHDDAELIAANRKKAKIAADHLLSLINDVLDMSKLEDDHVELVREPVNLIKLFTDAFTICGIKAKENGITFHHNQGINLTCPDVYASELHLKQVLMNLLNNCVKYNKPCGEINCLAETLSVDDNTVIYKFEISDTGIGMSEEYLKHIFEPFTQEKSDARSRYQGTGMGMAIVKKLVEKMNGTIGVESELGVGTKFTLIIPFEINKNPQKDGNSLEKTKADISGMRLLLVEDNELNTEIAKCLLEDAGAIVTVAENGQIAYETFEKHSAGAFDAILMDVMMPVLDGYQATEKIRKSGKADADTIPIIAMTANAFAEDVKRAKEAGMNEHVSKPLKIEKLIEVIARYT